MTEAKTFFSKTQKETIEKAIREAELNTSGEIRVHIENYCKKALLDRAAEVFEMLEIHKTELRNGVLFYFAIKDKQFAIIGDAGINKTVPKNFWENIKNSTINYFKKNMFTEGLCDGIMHTGKQLKDFFPYSNDDINELSDKISFGND